MRFTNNARVDLLNLLIIIMYLFCCLRFVFLLLSVSCVKLNQSDGNSMVKT